MTAVPPASPAPSPLICAAHVREALGAPGLVVLDASWTYPGGPQSTCEGHIPGALAFDIDTVADKSVDLPHMLPAPDEFERHMRALGISANSEIVVYDNIHLFTAPRVWWSLRSMGCDHVRVLDGGLPAWQAAGGEIAQGPAPTHATVPGDFTARPRPELIAALNDVTGALDDPDIAILDVRSKARFSGVEAEPRPGLRAGHMPNARNAPWTDLLNADGTLAAAERLRALFKSAGLEPGKPVITSCGSGVTASVAALALEVCGFAPWSVYDGSWTEWGARADTAVVTTPQRTTAQETTT